MGAYEFAVDVAARGVLQQGPPGKLGRRKSDWVGTLEVRPSCNVGRAPASLPRLVDLSSGCALGAGGWGWRLGWGCSVNTKNGLCLSHGSPHMFAVIHGLLCCLKLQPTSAVVPAQVWPWSVLIPWFKQDMKARVRCLGRATPRDGWMAMAAGEAGRHRDMPPPSITHLSKPCALAPMCRWTR